MVELIVGVVYEGPVAPVMGVYVTLLAELDHWKVADPNVDGLGDKFNVVVPLTQSLSDEGITLIAAGNTVSFTESIF